MITRNNGLLVIAFCILLIFGCSSGGGNPVEPLANSNSDFDSLMVGVSDFDNSGNPIAGYGAMGIFDVHIDAKSMTGEITPIRTGSLTDVLEVVDITNFLTNVPCTDCAKLDSISFDIFGNLVISMGIKHPFPAGDPIEPITGKNRGDLHVFNIEGIIVSSETGSSFVGLGETVAGFNIVNADGYTPYLDGVLDGIYPTSATIHPYILHFNDYTAGNFDASNPMGFASVTDPPPGGNLVMAMGCDYDYQDYAFDFANGESVRFLYAVGCTYAVSAENKGARFAPEFRIPQHNKKAASEISVAVVSNDLTEDDVLSTAAIEIHVVDISHGVSTGDNLDQMFADSSVSAITIDIPDIETGLVNVVVSSPTGTGHDPSDPLVFAATITNTANASEGTYSGLIKVTDSYAAGQNELSLLDGMDGIERVDPTESPLTGLFTISEFATYQVFSIDVAEDVPANIIYVDDSNITGIEDGTQAHPYTTIQEGINAAPVDFTVLVDDSGYAYNEEVQMKSGVTLLSSNWDDNDGTDRALIDCNDTPDARSVHFNNVDNATLSGFQIGFGGEINFQPLTEMIFVDGGTGNTIQDCLFTGDTNLLVVFPVYADGSSNLTIANCEFSDIDTDTAIDGCCIFSGIQAESCPNLIIRNNIFTNIRPTQDDEIIDIWVAYVYDSDNLIVKNNLIHDIVLSTGGNNMAFVNGFVIENCTDAHVINNTVDNLDSTDASEDQMAIAYYIDMCTNTSFSNNIASTIQSVGLPTPMAIGVIGFDPPVVCDYSDTWDIGPGVNGANYYEDASAGTDCIITDPDYINPSTGNYDVSLASPAQSGDPTIDDWDGAVGGGSRMGCHGGPGGEIVGLLT